MSEEGLKHLRAELCVKIAEAHKEVDQYEAIYPDQAEECKALKGILRHAALNVLREPLVMRYKR